MTKNRSEVKLLFSCFSLGIMMMIMMGDYYQEGHQNLFLIIISIILAAEIHVDEL